MAYTRTNVTAARHIQRAGPTSMYKRTNSSVGLTLLEPTFSNTLSSISSFRVSMSIPGRMGAVPFGPSIS